MYRVSKLRGARCEVIAESDYGTRRELHSSKEVVLGLGFGDWATAV